MGSYRHARPRPVSFEHARLIALVREDLNENLPRLESAWHPLTVSAFISAQVDACSEKYCDPLPGSARQRKSLAVEKFLAMEYRCEQYNRILSNPSWVDAIIEGAAHHIHRCLGPLHSGIIYRACAEATIGNGTTVLRKGDDSNVSRKLSGFMSATASTTPFVRAFVRANPGWTSRMTCFPTIVDSDSLFTVPKNSEIDRIAGKQPCFNLALQLGAGLAIERRAKRYFGTDIRDQSCGWERARMGSIYGNYATIDLSSASDTISTTLVRRLLPSDWFEWLSALRVTRYSGLATGVYEKFSAMGNGFTFPLETLIFAALVRATQDALKHPWDAVVYGDDIVVPARDFEAVCIVLDSVGFIPNPSKSFNTGPFRETCGKDFHFGIDIRPVFLLAPLRNEVDVYNFHNRLLLNRQGVLYPRTLAYLRSLVPSGFVQPAYYGAGDNWMDWKPFVDVRVNRAFIVREDEAPFSPVRCRNTQQEVWKLMGWEYIPTPEDDADQSTYMSMSLYTGHHLGTRFRRGRWMLRPLVVARWYEV